MVTTVLHGTPEDEQRQPFPDEGVPFRRSLTFWSAVLLAALFAAFVLPFFFPPQHATFSPAYTTGSSNRAGAIGVAVVALLAAWGCLRLPFLRSAGLYSLEGSPGARVALSAVFAVVVFSAALGRVVVRSGRFYADAGYFVTQLRSGLVFHRALYQGVEFAYGPLLYLWPAAFVRVLHGVGWSIAASYMASLVVLEAAGTLLLYWTVSSLPMGRRARTVVFALMVLLTLEPQAGLNYTAFRFILPTAAMVFLAVKARRPATGFLVALCATVLNFAVSPELGLAFAAGSACYALYRSLVLGWAWLAVGAGTLAGAAAFVLAAGRGPFQTMLDFAAGGYNDILQPAPHICFLLVCAVTAAPLAVGSALRDAARARSRPAVDTAALLLGIFIAGLAMLAPALGRCDPLHVSLNGWALFLLTAIAVDRMGRPARRAWLAAAVLFCGYSLLQEFGQQRVSLVRMVRRQPDPLETLDLSRLRQATHGQPVVLPMNQAGSLLDRLSAQGLYQPLFLCIPPADAAQEERLVQDMRRAGYALIPGDVPPVSENRINNDGLRYAMRFHYRYPARRPPFLQGAIVTEELKQHWQLAGNLGDYTLYRRDD